jgi:hypothetical protein
MKMNNFAHRIRKFGLKRIFLSWDFILAFALFCFVLFFRYEYAIKHAVEVMTVVRDIAATLGTIILGGFALVVSLTDNKFIKFLRKVKVYDNIVFSFEYNIILSVICILLSFFTQFILYADSAYFSLFLVFPYLILSILRLVSFITSFGIKRAEFVELE